VLYSLRGEHLQEARRRSGRLGGRPRKVTSAEARERALKALVPPAVAALRAHLGDGDPAAWRAGLRVLELAYGSAPPPATEDVPVPATSEDVTNLGWSQMQILAARLIADIPTSGSENTAITNGTAAIVTVGGTATDT
jgi:hypothetical protein